MDNDKIMAKANEDMLKMATMVVAIMVAVMIGLCVMGDKNKVLLIICVIYVTSLYFGSVFLFRKNNSNKMSRTLLFCSLITPWIVSTVFLSNFYINFIIMPVILMFAFYADRKFMNTIMVASVVINLIDIARTIMQGNVDYQLMAEIVVLFLTFLLFNGICGKVTKAYGLFIKNAQSSINAITEAKEKQDIIMEKVLESAREVADNSKGVKEVVSEIASSSEVVGAAIQEIAKGATTTAEDI